MRLCGTKTFNVGNILLKMCKFSTWWTVFSERELMLTFAICCCPSVCLSLCLSVACRLSSITIVHPTQAVEIFGNVSTPFGTLVNQNRWHPRKIYGDRPRGTPTPGELSTSLDLSKAISRKRCKIGGKLVLITIWAFEFRLVLKSVTLNDLERRNGVILRYFSEFG